MVERVNAAQDRGGVESCMSPDRRGSSPGPALDLGFRRPYSHYSWRAPDRVPSELVGEPDGGDLAASKAHAEAFPTSVDEIRPRPQQRSADQDANWPAF